MPTSPAALYDALLDHRDADSIPDTTALLARLWRAARSVAPPRISMFRGGPHPGGLTRSDEDLLRAFQAGDAEALDTLATRHLGRLKGHALRHLPESDVDDAVQDAMMVVLRDAKTLEGSGAFRRFAFRVLDIELLRRQRIAGRATDRTRPLDEGEIAEESAEQQPDISFLRKQEVQAVAEAMHECLDLLDQQLLLLWLDGEEDGSISKTVGTALEMDPGTVRVRKHRALRRLRLWLEARGISRG
ncbi:MAG: sigma-70 family RNA polymerase sigma factor [Deltaproteobacteria bacterium]|nr:sigma-70 family RNA polymerase sigma factor [Myxococcales bacterium]MDP3218131.1 sigma-70 family RNA polymerase sigma factor [Deltaproteobacteria bacterium]